jgi:hypothetical protein
VLEKLLKFQKTKFEIAAMKAYERALFRLKKWFDFKNSSIKTFKRLILQKEMNFEQIVACFKLLGVQFDGGCKHTQRKTPLFFNNFNY